MVATGLYSMFVKEGAGNYTTWEASAPTSCLPGCLPHRLPAPPAACLSRILLLQVALLLTTAAPAKCPAAAMRFSN